MTVQLGTTVRNARADIVESTIGTAPKLMIRTGAQPGACATADSGTLLAMLTLPSDWQSGAAAGVKNILGGPWTVTAIAAGTAAHYRLKDSTATTTDNTGTTHEQGNITMPVTISTNGVTAANSNVLNFAATTGVVDGMNISGTGIVAGSTVLATTGTTVTMSMASTAGVSSAVSITFAGDLYLDNTNIAINQTVSVSAWTKTEPNA